MRRAYFSNEVRPLGPKPNCPVCGEFLEDMFARIEHECSSVCPEARRRDEEGTSRIPIPPTDIKRWGYQ